MTQRIFVSLPVRDLARSKAFYEAIGFTNNPQFSGEDSACMVLTDEIYVMLSTHAKWATFTKKTIPDTSTMAQFALCLSRQSRAAVNDTINAAKRGAGLADPGPPEDHGFMYSRSFEDPDGHHWEAVWMDPEAAGAPKTEPPADRDLCPHLVCAGAAQAIEFYARAFDAEEIMRLPGANGKIMHASLRLNGRVVMLVDENPDFDMLGPKALGGAPVTLHLKVPNADEAAARAVAAGAAVLMPVADQFWGDRYGIVVDPFGHRWALASTKRAMTADEINAAAMAAMPDYAKERP